jgi:hypothetical protein
MISCRVRETHHWPVAHQGLAIRKDGAFHAPYEGQNTRFAGDPMTLRLSEEQRQAIEEHGGTPVYVVDDHTNAKYVLLKDDQYEKLKGRAGEEEVDALYPLLAEIEPDDWEDRTQFDQ